MPRGIAGASRMMDLGEMELNMFLTYSSLSTETAILFPPNTTAPGARSLSSLGPTDSVMVLKRRV